MRDTLSDFEEWEKQKKEDMSIKKLSSDLLQGFNLDEALV